MTWKSFFKENGLEYILHDPIRQYNGDETGFQTDPKSGKVLAVKGQSTYTEAGGNKEQVTQLVTTRTDGRVTTSVIVYPYRRQIPKNTIDSLPAVRYGLKALSCSPFISRKSRQGAPTNSKLFRNGSEKSGLGGNFTPPPWAWKG